MKKKLKLILKPLNDDAFAPFGDVIQKQGHYANEINAGQTRKYADLAQIDVIGNGGSPAVHIYRSRPVSLPFRIQSLEKHPTGSQAFMPLHTRPFPIVVAPPSDQPEPASIQGFLTNGEQGVNLHRGVWHHYQITLEQTSDYLVIDRSAIIDDTVVAHLETPLFIVGLV